MTSTDIPGREMPESQMCPEECGCRLGTNDADRFECGCYGPCTGDVTEADIYEADGGDTMHDAEDGGL